MSRKLLPVVALSLLIAACAIIPHKEIDSNPAFSQHQYNSCDIGIIWKSEKSDKQLQIEGTITNVRHDSAYENLELEALILNSRGDVIAQQTFNVKPLKMKGSVPFRMEIPLPGDVTPERVKFNYRYGIGEDRYSVSFTGIP